MKSKFAQHISEIKKSNPEAISVYEKLSSSKVDDAFGVNNFNKMFEDLKGQSKTQISGLIATFGKQVDDLAEKLKGKINELRPKLPLFDSLPQCLKDKVMTEGSQKFGTAIEAMKKQQADFIKINMSFDALMKQVESKLPGNQVK